MAQRGMHLTERAVEAIWAKQPEHLTDEASKHYLVFCVVRQVR